MNMIILIAIEMCKLNEISYLFKIQHSTRDPSSVIYIFSRYKSEENHQHYLSTL